MKRTPLQAPNWPALASSRTDAWRIWQTPSYYFSVILAGFEAVFSYVSNPQVEKAPLIDPEPNPLDEKPANPSDKEAQFLQSIELEMKIRCKLLSY